MKYKFTVNLDMTQEVEVEAETEEAALKEVKEMVHISGLGFFRPQKPDIYLS